MGVPLELIAGLIQNLEEKFTKRFAQMDKGLEQSVSRMERIESKLERHDQLLQQLIEMTAETNIRLSELTDKLDKLDIKFEMLAKDFKEIKENMATKKDLAYFDQMVSEHSREIYKLKMGK
ncbi:hypothetical protein ACE38V_20380 [Cytobacillus sp. Hz8]|uniref:hypothetical protein n=1 Tax=Cytobacillus sp. Hz8 TaxID=3347168 RepID=UPI0035D8BF25